MGRERGRVLLADDCQLVAEGVRRLLSTRFEVVGVVGDEGTLLTQVRTLGPAVVLIDPALAGDRGFDAIRRLRRERPGTKVVVLTTPSDMPHVRAAFEAGADGYALKCGRPRELFDALDTVLAGRRYVVPALASDVMDAFLTEGTTAPVSPLTTREVEIAGLVGEGLENAQIAHRLCIAEVTVRTHFRSILHKLSLGNRVQLARYALRLGWSSRP